MGDIAAVCVAQGMSNRPPPPGRAPKKEIYAKHEPRDRQLRFAVNSRGGDTIATCRSAGGNQRRGDANSYLAVHPTLKTGGRFPEIKTKNRILREE